MIQEENETNQNNRHAEESSLQTLARQMFQTRIFLGDFTERRYVNSLEAYRDVIIVNNREIELINDLQDVYRRIYKKYAWDPNFWIGISTNEPDAVQRLWVEIPNIPFGKYFFTIKNVKFRTNEVILRIKILREVSTVDAESILNVKTKNYDLDEYISDYKEACKQNVLYFFDQVLTLRNIFKLLQFLAVILVTSISGGFEAIKFLGDFLIRFVREISIFTSAATPIFLGVIDFFSKVVGGFYILISMMWKGSGIQPSSQRYAIQNRPTSPRRSIKY